MAEKGVLSFGRLLKLKWKVEGKLGGLEQEGNPR